MFYFIVIVEGFYKNGNTSKNTNRKESERASHGRKRKGGEAVLPTNTEKGSASKHKTNNEGRISNQLTVENMLYAWPWALYERV